MKPDFVADYLECVNQEAARATERIDDLLADFGVNSFNNELNDVARRKILAKAACEGVSEKVFERFALYVEGVRLRS